MGGNTSLITTGGPTGTDTSRISHPVRNEVLLVGPGKQMGPRSAGKNGHVIPSVRLQTQRHGAGKLVILLVHIDLVQIASAIPVQVALVARSIGVADCGVR